jgi:hypothetical protein
MADLSITAASVVAGSNATIDRSGLAGVTITAGQTVYWDTASSRWKLADNNGSGTRAPGGIALNGASSGQPLAVQTSGDITIGATLTAGTAYYLSATAGGICPVGDLSSGDDVALLGVAKSTTVLRLGIIAPGVTL